jgi:hypothetical protein
MMIFGRMLSIELINGCGLFLEFADSRAVWCANRETGETYAMPFEGVLLHLPFILISFGRVYEEVEG